MRGTFATAASETVFVTAASDSPVSETTASVRPVFT